MAADISNIIFLIIYEFFIIFSSIRITYFFTKKFNEKILAAENVIAWITIGLILNLFIVSIFSFLQYNGIIQYMLTSFLIVLILHLDRKSQLIIYKNYLIKTLNSIFNKMLDWKIIVIVSALIPVILFSMRPVSDFDSLVFLNHIFYYMFNDYTPYVRAGNYVPVWELSYLPHMIVSSSDNFFWLTSFKPLIIIGLAIYLIGREINLPKYLIWISIFSSILYFKIWITTAGSVGSLKNDYIFAAGVVLIIYSIIRSLRNNPDRLSYLFFSLGIIFLTIKFSGIPLGIVAIAVFIFLNKNRIFKNKKKITVWAFFVISLFLLTTGHYYVKNFLEYGNPLYPVKINILEEYFPGTKDLSSTTIYSNLGNPELTNTLFPTSKISTGGLLFPIFVLFGFGGTLGVIVVMSFRYLKTKKIEPAILVIAFLILITWSLYIITPYSAGQREGNLGYISQNELASTRYIIATLFVTELFFTFILWRLKIPMPIIFSIIGINAISRYWIILNSGITKFVEPLFIIYPLIFLGGSFLFVKYSKKIIPNIMILTTLFILILIFSPNVVDANREGWIPWHLEVATYLHELPPSEIFLVREPGFEIRAWTYPIYGKEFQHNILVRNQMDLVDILSDEMSKDLRPDYIVKLCQPHGDCSLNFNELESKLLEYNYEPLIKTDKSILLKNSN